MEAFSMTSHYPEEDPIDTFFPCHTLQNLKTVGLQNM